MQSGPMWIRIVQEAWMERDERILLSLKPDALNDLVPIVKRFC